MRADEVTFEAADAKPVCVHRWLPDAPTPVKGVVHVVHGMAEHGGRYARLAEALTAVGYAVYANDQRGHGKTGLESERGIFAASGGFRRVLADLEQLLTIEAQWHPGVPQVLFGHSMGASIAEACMVETGESLAGVILSGSSGELPVMTAVGEIVARIERRRLGSRGRSLLLKKMSFDAFNRPFEPSRTAFDWLSRDEAEVDRYIADPDCGFQCSTSLWVDLLGAMRQNARLSVRARIPRNLPIYVFSGSEDPVGGKTRNVMRLLKSLRRVGIAVEHRFYPGGRHEMLNEANRAEVLRDLLDWIERVVARGPEAR